MRHELTIAGILFFALGTEFLTFLMVGEAVAPDYVVHQNAISDLGVIGQTELLFTLSLSVAGLFNILGGYLFYRSHHRRGTLALYVLAGIGAIGAALIALDSPLGLHGLFALLAFLFFNAQAIATGPLVGGPMKLISFAAGIIGLAFLVLMILGDGGIIDLFGSIGHGGTERMIVYPSILWTVAFGGYLMASEK